jgi:hypothetical protein
VTGGTERGRDALQIDVPPGERKVAQQTRENSGLVSTRLQVRLHCRHLFLSNGQRRMTSTLVNREPAHRVITWSTPPVEEGCRPASQGLTLTLITSPSVTRTDAFMQCLYM